MQIAQSGGLYLGLGGGAVLPLDSSISGTSISTSADLDAGWTGVGIIGYRFASGVRSEVEFGYRSADIDSLSGVTNGTGGLSVGSVMGNATYSLQNESKFTPILAWESVSSLWNLTMYNRSVARCSTIAKLYLPTKEFSALAIV